MRACWALIGAVWASGCAVAWCPPGAPGGPVATCSTEHEPCGRDAVCARGLDCVSTVLCTIGPCPGTCLAACDDGADCGDGELCEAPDGWSADEAYCVVGLGAQ